jgi:glyoxylate reductase
LPGGALARLEDEHDVEAWPERGPPSPADLLARARDADGLLCLLSDRVDATLMDACPRLVAISVYAVGTDSVDLAAATERGIQVGHTPDVLTETTADLAFALMLAVARRVVEGDGLVRLGEWPPWAPDAFLGVDVNGARLGVVGMGRIGSAVARRAEGFGMEVIHSGRAGGLPLGELLDRSDFVSLHVPLDAQTHGLIGEDELRRMKPDAILVNTARGEIVDTAALVRALGEGWIGGAGLDVTDPEPLPADHPLLELPNVVVTPHIGSATRRTREAMADLAVDNLLAGLRGERMPRLANPEVTSTRPGP